MNNQKNDEKKLKVLFNKNNQVLAKKFYYTLTNKLLTTIRDDVKRDLNKKIQRDPQFLEKEFQKIRNDANITPKFINGDNTGARQKNTLRVTITKFNSKVNNISKIVHESPIVAKTKIKNHEDRQRDLYIEYNTSIKYVEITTNVLMDWSVEILSNTLYSAYRTRIHDKLGIKGILGSKDIINNPILVYFARSISSAVNKTDRYIAKFVSDIKDLVNEKVKSTRKVNYTGNNDYDFKKVTDGIKARMKKEHDEKKKVFENAIKTLANRKAELAKKNTKVVNVNQLKQQILNKRKAIELKRQLAKERLQAKLLKQRKANVKRAAVRRPVGVGKSLKWLFS